MFIKCQPDDGTLGLKYPDLTSRRQHNHYDK